MNLCATAGGRAG